LSPAAKRRFEHPINLFLNHLIPNGSTVSTQDELIKLSHLIESAKELAIAMDQDMAAYVLSIAGLEIAQKIAKFEPRRLTPDLPTRADYKH
jgi:hypothetical protein